MNHRLLLLWRIPKVERRRLGSAAFAGFRFKYALISVVSYLGYLLAAAGADFGMKAACLQGLMDLSPTRKDYGFPLLLGLFLTGNFVEEIVGRGDFIESVSELTGRRWVAGLVSCIGELPLWHPELQFLPLLVTMYQRWERSESHCWKTKLGG